MNDSLQAKSCFHKPAIVKIYHIFILYLNQVIISYGDLRLTVARSAFKFVAEVTIEPYQ